MTNQNADLLFIIYLPIHGESISVACSHGISNLSQYEAYPIAAKHPLGKLNIHHIAILVTVAIVSSSRLAKEEHYILMLHKRPS